MPEAIRTPDKRIINPARINLLWAIRNNGETNCNTIGSNAKPSSITLSISQFARLGLVQFIGGYFQIAPQNSDYLYSLKEPIGACLMC